MAINLFVPQFDVDACLSEIRVCLEKGWTGLGFKTVEFEDAWKRYTGLPHAHFLSSNTVGLHLALHVFKSSGHWSDSDEVITTPITFVSSNHAIVQTSLTPVFADVDEFGCLDPTSVAARITKKTRAVMFVGLGGNVGQYDAIRKLCVERGLKLILDAAHMAGTRDASGTHIGYDADVTVFSFQAVKNLPTADSGMICFRDIKNDERARKLSWLGINKDTFARTAAQGAYKWMYDVEEPGFKYHGNSIMAAIGLVQLRHLDRDNAYRRTLSQWYDTTLAGCRSIKRVPMAIQCESSRHLYQIRVANRDELLLALNRHEIYPGVHYRDNTHYAMYSYASDTCPIARSFSNSVLSLPLHMGLSHADVRSVANAVIKYAK
jgi:dTDP-4-amino-4,6-dideoxygalactose transaminase